MTAITQSPTERVATERGAADAAADAPIVSVILATRNRPHDVARCLPSVLACDYPRFEVIIADQSTDDATEAIAAAQSDSRMRYLRLGSTGKSRALNVALPAAEGDVIAFTDDDCSVPVDWLWRSVSALNTAPHVGIVFGALEAIPHDPDMTFVPAFQPRAYRQLQGRTGRRTQSGLGGNMIVRRAVFDAIGQYDEILGAGGLFPSCEDADINDRALAAGFAVIHDPTNSVLHWGGREYADDSAQRLIRGYFAGQGALLAKEIRCGDPVAAYRLLRHAAHEAKLAAVGVLPGRSPAPWPSARSNFRPWFGGFMRGIRHPLDRRTGTFRSASPGEVVELVRDPRKG